MELFQTWGESVGEKLPLKVTLGFSPLQTIYMHTNLFKTREERENPKNIIGPPLIQPVRSLSALSRPVQTAVRSLALLCLS